MATQSQVTNMTPATVAEAASPANGGIVISDQDVPDNLQVQNASSNSLIIEQRAQTLVNKWNAVCAKLADLYDEVTAIQDAFGNLAPGQTIMECRSFKMFCIRHLHRDPSTVYRMMANSPW